MQVFISIKFMSHNESQQVDSNDMFIMLYKVFVTYRFVDETLVCDHSNESYWAVLSCGTVYHAVQGGSYL